MQARLVAAKTFIDMAEESLGSGVKFKGQNIE